MSEPENVVDNATPWVAAQIREYVESDGAAPDHMGSPLLLLTTLGRKSGQWRRTALIYGEVDGAYAIVASLGGAPENPSWYLNLVDHPEVYLQVGADKFRAIARTATPEEKPALWKHMVEVFPTYESYQEKTQRDIPVVILERA